MESIRNLYIKLDLKKNFIFYLFIITLILAMLLISKVLITSTNQKEYINEPRIDKAVSIDEVNLIGSDGSNEKVKLPLRKSSENSYYYKFVVPKNSTGMQQFVNVNSMYASFVIRHENEVIYEKKYIGKELEIEFRSTLKNGYELMIPAILIGTISEIKSHFFFVDLFKIIAGIILFITAIFIACVGIFFVKIGQKARNLFIAVLFAMIMSYYIIFNSWIVFYYFDNSVISYFIVYTCLILIPLPIFLLFLNIFYENTYCDWRTKSYELIILGIIANLIVQWTLTLSGKSEFIYMREFTLAILAFSFIYIFISVATVDDKKYENKNYLLLSITPLAMLMIASVFGYYMTYRVPMIPLIIISSIFFMLIHFVMVLKRYVIEYNTTIENEFYNQLAYYDTLTELSNRHDFDRDVMRILSKEINFENMSLIMMDMNNLKEINDNYGHKVGDLFLKKAGEFFTNLENKYGNIKAYRYGGDEFILLIYDKRQKEVEKIINEINYFSHKKILDKCDYNLEFAIGCSSCYNQNNFDIVTFKDQADKLMYEDKVRKKGGKENVR